MWPFCPSHPIGCSLAWVRSNERQEEADGASAVLPPRTDLYKVGRELT